MEAKEQNSTSVNNSFMQESVMDINNVLESTRTKEGKTMETNAENIEQEMKAKRKKKELEQQPIQQEETLNPLEVKIQQMQQKINALEKQLEEKNNFSNINKPNITETTNEESEITQTAQTNEPLPKVKFRSLFAKDDQEFTGQNIGRIETFRKQLINNIISKDDDVILVSKKQLEENGIEPKKEIPRDRKSVV